MRTFHSAPHLYVLYPLKFTKNNIYRCTHCSSEHTIEDVVILFYYCYSYSCFCCIVTESNQNYHQIPLLVDQAISRVHTAQQLLLQRSVINFDENVFSPRTWAASVAELNTSQCSREFSNLLNGTQREEKWAIQLVDAWGKPLPSGVLTGNTYWVGNYDECLDDLYEVEHKSFLHQLFDSQYCKYLKVHTICCIV